MCDVPFRDTQTPMLEGCDPPFFYTGSYLQCRINDEHIKDKSSQYTSWTIDGFGLRLGNGVENTMTNLISGTAGKGLMPRDGRSKFEFMWTSGLADASDED